MSWGVRSKIGYDYSKLYKKAIPKPRTDKGWGKTYKSLYNFIKFHYSVVQDDICAYCRMPIKFNGYGEPIEHIVPKSFNSYWMYHPKNLCLACYGCNTKKKDKETLTKGIKNVSKKYADYPKNSGDFKIIHPHYDKISDFIDFKGIIIKPNPADSSNKGYNTIECCKLNRLDLMYQRARIKNLTKTKVHSIALNIVNDPNSTKKEKDAAQEMIVELIKRFNYRRSLLGR